MKQNWSTWMNGPGDWTPFAPWGIKRIILHLVVDLLFTATWQHSSEYAQWRHFVCPSTWAGWSYRRKQAKWPTWSLNITRRALAWNPEWFFYHCRMALTSVRLPFLSWKGTICSISPSFLSLGYDYVITQNFLTWSMTEERSVLPTICSLMDTEFSCLGNCL